MIAEEEIVVLQELFEVTVMGSISPKGNVLFSMKHNKDGKVVNIINMDSCGHFTYLESPFTVDMFHAVKVNKQGVKEIADFKGFKLMLCANSMLYVVQNGIASAKFVPCNRSIVSGLYIDSDGKLVAPANTIYCPEDYSAMVAVAQASSFNKLTSKPLGFGSKVKFHSVTNRFVPSGFSVQQLFSKLGISSIYASKTKSINNKTYTALQAVLTNTTDYKWVYPPQIFEALLTDKFDLYD